MDDSDHALVRVAGRTTPYAERYYARGGWKMPFITGDKIGSTVVVCRSTPTMATSAGAPRSSVVANDFAQLPWLQVGPQPFEPREPPHSVSQQSSASSATLNA